MTPPEDRFMKKARILTDMWISRGGPTLDEFTKMISDALREQEEETIKGRANVSVAIADCGHPQEMKLMMLLCKGCEHWNQLEKIKTLQSRIEKLEKAIEDADLDGRGIKTIDYKSLIFNEDNFDWLKRHAECLKYILQQKREALSNENEGKK